MADTAIIYDPDTLALYAVIVTTDGASSLECHVPPEGLVKVVVDADTLPDIPAEVAVQVADVQEVVAAQELATQVAEAEVALADPVVAATP